MELQLGRHAFDVTTRAVIMSSVWQEASALQEATSLVAQGAEIIHVVGVGDDLVELIALLVAELDVPITFGNWGHAPTIAAAFEAGGSLTRSSAEPVSDAECLALAANAGAALTIHHVPDTSWIESGVPIAPKPAPVGPAVIADRLAERFRFVTSSGVPPDRVITNTTPDVLTHLPTTQALRMFEPGTGPGAQGANVVALMAGARILATNDVRATRRTADTVSELLTRRASPLPAELINAGAH